MPKNLGSLARSLSMEEIKALLAIKEQLIEAEAKRAEIESELKRMDAEILTLVKKLNTTGRPTRTLPARKKKTPARGKTRRPASARKKAAASTGRGRGKGGKSLEQVVADLIRSKGGTMMFPDIKSTIVKRKLFATRSKNFDNVLRRTISSSKLIKRVSRGKYTV